MRTNRKTHCGFCALVFSAFYVSALSGAENGFLRGDANHDGQINISDAICGLSTIFALTGAPCNAPSCRDALDTNDDGSLDIADAISTLLFLFEGGSLPPPSVACGSDPTEDPLSCLVAPQCGNPTTITFEVVPDLKMYSIWTEANATVEQQYSILSTIDFKAGLYEISLEQDTTDIELIEAVRFGAELLPATPTGKGKFVLLPNSLYPLEYKQSFGTEDGELLLVLQLGQAGGEQLPTKLDCMLLESEFIRKRALLRGQLNRDDSTRLVHYSCFYPESWFPEHFESLGAETDDNNFVLFYLEQCPICSFYVFGNTWNYRITKAAVRYEGEEFEVSGYERLVYAARHHNEQPEFRVLFDEERDGIVGIDVVSCPCDVQPGVTCPCPAKAYYLDSSLERIRQSAATLSWRRP